MTAAASADAARLPILLTELRLPTIKRMWESMSTQSDREGWRAEKLLSTLLDLEMAERAQRRLARHRHGQQRHLDRRDRADPRAVRQSVRRDCVLHDGPVELAAVSF